MKIKMLTTKCGPEISENWSEGQIRNVLPDEARQLELANLAIPIEPYPVNVEKPTMTQPEKAVIVPVETAKGKGQVTAQKTTTEHSASPEGSEQDKNKTVPLSWSKGEGK